MGKKIFIALIALVLNLICFSGVIFVNSYLVSSDKTVNTFVPGNSKLKIAEEFEKPETLKPGMEIVKKVSIENTGLCESKVRTLVLFSDSNSQKNARIDYNAGDWEYRDDGYWYYKGVLKPGEKTPCLFEKVIISGNAKAEDLKGFEIIVYSECINEESGGF